MLSLPVPLSQRSSDGVYLAPQDSTESKDPKLHDSFKLVFAAFASLTV